MARDRDTRAAASALPASAAGMTRARDLAAELRSLAANLEAEAGGASRPLPVTASSMADHARQVHAAHRLLDRLVGERLFGDPALDIMLMLFAAGEEGASLSREEGCAAAAVPSRTARRLLTLLERRALIGETPPHRPGGPAQLTLTDAGEEAVRCYLEALGRAAPGGYLAA